MDVHISLPSIEGFLLFCNDRRERESERERRSDISAGLAGAAQARAEGIAWHIRCSGRRSGKTGKLSARREMRNWLSVRVRCPRAVIPLVRAVVGADTLAVFFLARVCASVVDESGGASCLTLVAFCVPSEREYRQLHCPFLFFRVDLFTPRNNEKINGHIVL